MQQVALVPAVKELTAESSQCEICQFAATELFSILKDPYDQVPICYCFYLSSNIPREWWRMYLRASATGFPTVSREDVSR